ncbi:Xaa-Pro dipeptidyl-peptidase [Lentilactobacillus kefiri]|uniref:Xaa-Pro dipeptidyl-peptidase n=1 Tax=Lentilactobacillus kefiri TaxID=33962 RepID=UPI001FB483D3|nr:Xaa-Pro dipeptidyl-peptidase [Lentilactobacillus kefiri]UOD78693.1 Xaa-Pro dipeptidyl-peptidase [Lentilactobacillus kefiri]
MKISQFAYIPTNHQTIIKELKDTRFLDAQNLHIENPRALFRNLLIRLYSMHENMTTRIEKISGLLATPTENANIYTSQTGPVTKKAFYNVGLQLLGFLESLDFSINDPLAAMNKIGLPVIDGPDTFNCDQLIDAWYRLLNTRNKFGQLLIDWLAGKGYYQQFVSDADFAKPLFFNGKSQAVFDTSSLIRETVYVESPLDTDHDGKRDLLKVNVIRPAETDSGFKAPVIFTADPYSEGMNVKWAEKYAHDNRRPLKRKEPNQLTYTDVEYHYKDVSLPAPRTVKGETTKAGETFSKLWSYSLNDYFLARGFAVVYSGGVGTRDSDGLRTTGTRAETIGATSVIEWLHGDRTAFTNRTDQIAIKAWWSSGEVGMTGRSYLGTLSTAAAFTRVNGLKTSIVEAGLADYYDYYRENGLVVAPDGDDADALAEYTFSRQQSAADYATIKDKWLAHLKQMKLDQGHDSGSYNPFWDARKIEKVNHTKADMLLVHGLNDWNVKTSQVWNSRNRLKSRPITQKLILHQGQHEYLNNFRSFDYTDIVNLWLTNKLFNVDNHVNDTLADVIVQDNAQPETWTAYQDWGGSESESISYPLNNLINLNENNFISDQLPEEDYKAYDHDLDKWHHDLYFRGGSEMDYHCIRLLTKPLTEDLVIDGRPSVSLQVMTSQGFGMISVALVDYGKAKRLTETPQTIDSMRILQGYHWRRDDLKEFLPQKKETDFKRITQAHMNMQNRENSYKVDELKAISFYTLNIPFQPTFWRLLKGHQIGLVIYASDMEYTVHGNQDVIYTVDLKKSYLNIPKLR